MQEPIPPQISSKQNNKLTEKIIIFSNLNRNLHTINWKLIALEMEGGMKVEATPLLWVWTVV